MCFQFGSWRKASKAQSTFPATPQTLLTSSPHGKGKAVRFDSENREEVDPVRKEVRKATPWHCGSDANEVAANHIRFAPSSCTVEDTEGDFADPVRKEVRKGTPWHFGSDGNTESARHVRFGSSSGPDENMEPDLVDSARKEVRKGTPWHCGSDANAAFASHVRFASSSGPREDMKGDLSDPVRKEVRKSTPWHCGSDATAGHIQFAPNSCTDDDADEAANDDVVDPMRTEVRKATPWHYGSDVNAATVRTPKVAQWPTPMQAVGHEERSSRHIRWSVSAEQAFQASQGDEVAKADALRRPGRAATPFTSSAGAAESNEENRRHIQWCGADEESSPRRTDRKGTPWHSGSGAEAPDCGERGDKHVEWSDSVEEPSARRPERVDTPWLSGTQNADRAEETAASIQWSESVQDFSARQAVRKSTPWHAVGVQTMHTDDSEWEALEQEVSMQALAEEFVHEASNKVAPKGASLLTACWMCQSAPNVSTDELQVRSHAI